MKAPPVVGGSELPAASSAVSPVPSPSRRCPSAAWMIGVTIVIIVMSGLYVGRHFLRVRPPASGALLSISGRRYRFSLRESEAFAFTTDWANDTYTPAKPDADGWYRYRGFHSTEQLPFRNDETRITCLGGSTLESRTCKFEDVCYDIRRHRWTVFDPRHRYSIPAHPSEKDAHTHSDDSGHSDDDHSHASPSFRNDRHLRHHLPTPPINDNDRNHLLSLASVKVHRYNRYGAFPPPTIIPTVLPVDIAKLSSTHGLTSGFLNSSVLTSLGIPSKRRAVWIDRPTVLFYRHHPWESFGHSIMDDVFAVWWLFTTHFYPPTPSPNSEEVDGSRPFDTHNYVIFDDDWPHHTIPPGTAGAHWIWDVHYKITEWYGLFSSLLVSSGRGRVGTEAMDGRDEIPLLYWHQLSERSRASHSTTATAVSADERSRRRDPITLRPPSTMTPKEQRALIDSIAARYVCFSAVAMGAGGVTMQRNGAYNWHSDRTFNRTTAIIDEASGRVVGRRRNDRLLLDSPQYESAQRNFIDFLLRGFGLPARPPLSKPFDGSDRSQLYRTISAAYSVTDRPERQPPCILFAQRANRRMIMNKMEMKNAIQSVFGVSVFILQFELLPNIHQIRRVFIDFNTVILIGMHGTPMFNSVWMRPGTSVIEFVPIDYYQTAYNGQHLFGPVLSALGVKHNIIVLGKDDAQLYGRTGMHDDFRAPLPTLLRLIRSELRRMKIPFPYAPSLTHTTPLHSTHIMSFGVMNADAVCRVM